MIRSARSGIKKKKSISIPALLFYTSKKPLVFVRIACYLLTELHNLQQLKYIFADINCTYFASNRSLVNLLEQMGLQCWAGFKVALSHQNRLYLSGSEMLL